MDRGGPPPLGCLASAFRGTSQTDSLQGLEVTATWGGALGPGLPRPSTGTASRKRKPRPEGRLRTGSPQSPTVPKQHHTAPSLRHLRDTAPKGWWLQCRLQWGSHSAFTTESPCPACCQVRGLGGGTLVPPPPNEALAWAATICAPALPGPRAVCPGAPCPGAGGPAAGGWPGLSGAWCTQVSGQLDPVPAPFLPATWHNPAALLLTWRPVPESSGKADQG